MDVLTYALAKKLISETADSLGSLKGAPATIKSIEEIAGGHRVTFEWTGTSGAKQTQTMDVMEGAQGPQGEKGADGTNGVKGDKGDDGYSPTITVTEITGGHRVTVTDATGSRSFDVMDGQGGSGGDAKVFIAEYNVTTAQEINAFIDSNKEPFAPILIKRGNDYYTAITAQKQADNKVILRSFATLSGDYYVFMYTITDGSWSASNYPFQKKGDAYTKAETEEKIAEAMTDVDNEHFHPVTALPNPADEDPTKRPKENHEYILIDYEQDGTTIKSETHYLFYGGEYHQKPTGGISLDGYATEESVNTKIAKMGEFDVTPIPQGPTGANEINAVLSNKDNEYARLSYVRQQDGTLPNTVNLGVKSGLGDDSFALATTGYINGKALTPTGWGVARTGVATVTFNNSKWSSSATVDVSEFGFSSGADYDVVAQPTTGGTATPWGNAIAYVNADKGASSFSVSSVTMEESLSGTVNVKYTIFAKGYGAVAYTGEIPTGGTTGQVLTKRSDGDGDYEWQNKLPSYVVDRPEGSSPVSGNVVQVGSFVNTDGTEYGIFEFYYKTSALPAADATKTYSFSPLLDDYTIFEFIDQSGITSNGHVISSGRTDGTNRIIIQQFSKNNKNVMLRAYGDYTAQTALLRIKFIGAKNNA